MDIAAWLDGLGLAEYAPAFRDNHIDADVLTTLSDADLKELGVASLGHRRRLTAAIAALADGGAPAAPETGERRQVTVLFADLAGFTALSDGADPEEVHALLNRYFAAVDAAVERHGGRIDKHIGDGVMAVFGAPVAHTDDPLRAVRAAQAIHDAVAGLTTPAGHAAAVHIGVASGEVVASGTGSDAHREYTVIGDSVNLAARLQDRAEAGETLISDAVRRAVGPAARLAPLGPQAIKGLDQAVAVWRVDSLASVPTGDAFVGRAPELRHLTGALETAQREGCGQVVVVRGEPGIGKTRLLQETARLAGARDFACHVVQVDDVGTARGSSAMRALVTGLLDGDDTETLDRAQSDGRFPAEHRPFLNDLLDQSQPADLRAVYDAMDGAARARGRGAALAHLAETVAAPLLLAVEDVHWAAPEVLEQLAGLATAIAEQPALMLMTTRIDGDPIGAAWRGRAAATPLTTLDPPPLTHDDAVALAEALGAGDAAINACVTRADGNPLFLEQLVRGFADNPGAVPGTVQSVVLARVDRLKPADKAALQAAAVLGQRFPLAALRHVGETPAYEATGLLAAALLRPVGGELLFAHALIRDGVYATLLRPRREGLHRRAANWFAGTDPELHAEHLAGAADPAAPQAFLAAAEAQAEAFRFERALALARRGSDLAERPADRHAATMAVARYLENTGAPGDAIDVYREAEALARTNDGRCAALIGVAACIRLIGGYDRGVAALDAAQPLAAGDDLHLARIAFLRGALQFTVGDIDGCFAAQRAALEHARAAAAPELEARAIGGLADAHYARGRMRSGRADFQRCITLAREHGFGQIEIDNAFMLGITGRYVGEIPTSLAAIADAIDMARRVGNRRALILSLNCQGELLLESGRYEAAQAPFDEALAIVEAIGNKRLLPYMLMNQARLRWVTGDAAAAREVSATALEHARASEPRYVAPRVLGLTALAAADAETRAAALAEGEDILARGCTSHNHAWFRRDAIEACLDAGDWDGVAHHAAALEAFAAEEPFAWSDYYVAWGRALAAAGRGDADRAELERLKALAGELHFALPLPRLDAALART